MLTQAKLDQLALEFRALAWRAPRRTLFDGLPGGLDALWSQLAFFADSRQEHGLGDLVLAALLRGVEGETEPPPRQVVDVRPFPGGVEIASARTRLRVITRSDVAPEAGDSKAQVLFLTPSAEAQPEGGATPCMSVATFLKHVRRFMPEALARADVRWCAAFLDWLSALDHLAGERTMKDLTDALKFYDRNREKIESLLQFRQEIVEESTAFAGRLAAKFQVAGGVAGVTQAEGNLLRMVRVVRVGSRSYSAGLDVRIDLGAMTLHAEPKVYRDEASMKRPSAEKAQEVLAQLNLAGLAGDQRINPENPEALAYQALKRLFLGAEEALAKLA